MEALDRKVCEHEWKDFYEGFPVSQQGVHYYCCKCMDLKNMDENGVEQQRTILRFERSGREVQVKFTAPLPVIYDE